MWPFLPVKKPSLRSGLTNVAIEHIIEPERKKKASASTIAAFVQLYMEGIDVPPITINHSYELIDGLNRLLAARIAKIRTLRVNVVDCDANECFLSPVP